MPNNRESEMEREKEKEKEKERERDREREKERERKGEKERERENKQVGAPTVPLPVIGCQFCYWLFMSFHVIMCYLTSLSHKIS
jgi:hypothetical protein